MRGIERIAWRPTAVEWVALVLVGVAIAAIAVDRAGSWADSWASNIATEALSIAITIAVVERIVARQAARQARERVRPRTDRATYWMGLNLRLFGSSVAIDCSGSHLHTFKLLPDDLIELFEFWLSEQKHADAAHVDEPDARYPTLIASALDY